METLRRVLCLSGRTAGALFRHQGLSCGPRGGLPVPNRPTSTGLADSFIYLIVPFPLKKYFSSALSAWPQNDFPIIAYKQTFITDSLPAELRHCVKQCIASVWQISCL